MMIAALTEPEIGRPDDGFSGIDEREMRAGVAGILNRRPAVGLAVGVVRNGRLEFFHGHGLADIASGTPVTEDTVFRIGSITKTFTAIAVMQLCEHGLIDLDAAANDYLHGYRLVPAKAAHQPATVRHLLTHTAGLPEMVHPSRAYKPVLGQTVRFGQRVPTLAEFYRGGLHLVAEPGTTHTYSNHGFATLGQIVEDVSGQQLRRYFRDHISPYVFRIDLSEFGIGTSRVVFSREPGVGTTALHLDLALAPVSFDKQAATKNPRSTVACALGAVAMATAATAARRRRRRDEGVQT
jgi:CubicO group peptidase (beta-lactamase class C family)